MRKNVLFGSLTAVVFFVVAGACTCNDPGTNVDPDAGLGEEDSGEAGGGGGGGGGGGAGGGAGGAGGGAGGGAVSGDGGVCVQSGQACDVNAGITCCNAFCISGTCGNPVTCTAAGGACTSPTSCCTGSCSSGVCGAVQCKAIGSQCGGGAECCSSTCTNGTCAQVPGGTCGTLGENCTLDSQCCSTNCGSGKCIKASTCQAPNDLCFGNFECCSQICSKNDGGAGTCVELSGGCTQNGAPCSGSSNCCTRVCLDPGSGANVCQSVGGCRMTGESCRTVNDCCGGGQNPNGTVQCVGGRCDNGQSCNPVGNICGAAVTAADGGVIVDVNASQNCCDGKKAVCKADSSGVPRCFGGCPTGNCSTCPTGYTGQAPCCIAAGNVCQFKDQCCNGAPCLPQPDGGASVCTTSTCLALGASCDPNNSGCCNGTVCRGSELGFACQPPLGDGGSGTVDAGCKINGAGCANPGDCCSQLCVNSVCATPSSCQPLDAVCTSSADCCSTLSCVIPAGSPTGTCKPAPCASAGQSCAVGGTQCCTNLNCSNSGGTTCAAGQACTCNVIIN